jgi:hypothetical protein
MVGTVVTTIAVLPPPLPSRLDDFPEWIDAMVVKELRQGLRARWFLVPFLAVHAAAVTLVWLEYLGVSSKSGIYADTGRGHMMFWGLVFLVVAGILPLRGLTSLHDEITGGNSQLIVLTGLSRWRIAAGKWLTQVVLAGLILVSLVPYAIVRYFFGGVEMLGNLAALLIVLGANSAVSALIIGASGYPGYTMRATVTGVAYVIVALPAFWLLFLTDELRGLDSGHFVELILTLSVAVAAAESFAFYTLCGLQLVRARLRLALRPWEIPPSRPVIILILLGQFYIMLGALVTCGFGAFVVAALMIWWVCSLDSDRVRMRRRPGKSSASPNPY